MTSRRDFIKQSAVFTAGALAYPSVKAFNIKEKPKVLIIGAGLAGLAAAYKLKSKGCEVVILEARNRVGGRVFSYNVTEDLVIELGAEWVGASHLRIISLSNELGLKLENNQFETDLIYANNYFQNRKWDYSGEWKIKFQKILEKYSHLSEADKMKLDKLDWWRFLINNGIDERDLQIRELLDSTDFGESIRFVSAYAAISEYAESSEKNEMDYKIKGGNQKLTELLAEKIGIENIRLRRRVTEIDQSGNKVKVMCHGGETFNADYVICTIPTYAVSKIKWLPELPGGKNSGCE